MKKIAVLMSLVLMLCAIPLTAYAEQSAMPYAASTPAAPNWDYAADIITSLYYDGTTVGCSSVIAGSSKVTSITVEQTLQKQGLFWIFSKYDDKSVWTKTVSGKSINFYNEKTVTESGKYRVKTVVTLTASNGKTEKITDYSEIVEI